MIIFESMCYLFSGFITKANSNIAAIVKKVADSLENVRFAYTSSKDILDETKNEEE